MTAREILHRVAEQIYVLYLFAAPNSIIDRRFKHADLIARGGFFTRSTSIFADLPLDQSIDDSSVNSLLEGNGSALGFIWKWNSEPSVWHLAPDTGRIWPQCIFCRIDYRPGNPIGDARVVWEPSRLQHMVELALIARSHPVEKTRKQAGDSMAIQLESWCSANPFPMGIHYVSSMECALRLIAVCVATDLVRGTTAFPRLAECLPQLVSSHGYIIENRLSLYSSAGNHTVAEGTGLIFAGVLFPELPGSKRWQEKGLDLLKQEAPRQILADGGGIEQAFWYHLFVVELIGLALWLLDYEDTADLEIVRRAFQRGRDFLKSLATKPEELPNVGDSDDGRALSDRLALVFENAAIEHVTGLRTFEASGYSVIFRSRSWRLLFDHGALGMPPNFGHGHADALSILLDIQGHSMLCDTGTYMYGGDPDRRRYFRGTAAHNTVTVDGLDQAVQATSFAWKNPFKAELLYSSEEDGVYLLLAKHDGYRRQGVTHLRAVYVDKGGLLGIWDHFLGTGSHQISAHWHFGTTVCACDDYFNIKMPDNTYSLKLIGDTIRRHVGIQDHQLGWSSPKYGQLSAIKSLENFYEGTLPKSLGLILAPGENVPHPDQVEHIRLRLDTLIELVGN